MIFPFEITYKKILLGEIEKFTTTEILEFYENEFTKSGADSVQKNNDCIIVKNNLISILSFKPGNNLNRWIGVTSPRLQILAFEDNKRIAIYKVNLTKILVVGTILGTFLGLLVHSIRLGFIVFFVLGILNWVIAIFQHQFDFDDFISERKHNLNKN